MAEETEQFRGLVAQALNRMDEKGETAAEAAENVTGGNRKLDAMIVRALQGETIVR
jgi:flagellar hook-basal body complex protein FliE